MDFRRRGYVGRGGAGRRMKISHREPVHKICKNCLHIEKEITEYPCYKCDPQQGNGHPLMWEARL